jgi:hypothetical protein
MKPKVRNLSRNTKSIARRAIVQSALNTGSKEIPKVIILAIKRSFKTFKAGINKYNLERGISVVNSDDIALQRMLKKEQNISLQKIYLMHLEGIATSRSSMYVSKEHKENKKLERAIAREKRQATYQEKLNSQKQLSA